MHIIGLLQVDKSRRIYSRTAMTSSYCQVNEKVNDQLTKLILLFPESPQKSIKTKEIRSQPEEHEHP